ncbi:organic cation [Stylonychia lemnae]|uniref:Organic cation n=1 Tax=Stylonychia lemnae TaxID=5949 RepID=A0A078APR1_STYLE|nr:organic cation [Stylonychia lemnae]|eukprot:CDW82898.1 organic cation [Stylonychia lemnae]
MDQKLETELVAKNQTEQSEPIIKQDAYEKLIIGSKSNIDANSIIEALPFGKFQYIFGVSIFIHYCTAAIVTYNYGYLLMYPSYQCEFNNEWQTCTRQQMCEQRQNPTFNWKIDEGNNRSLNNWVQKFNLHCSDSYIIGLFGSIDFLGQLIASFIFPPLSDKYGRRIIVVSGMVLQMLIILGMFFISNYLTMYLVIFILGMTFTNKNFVTYSHLMEFMGKRASFLTGLIFFCDSLIFIITPLIILNVSKNMNAIVGLALFSSILVLVLTFMNVFPESIIYNLSVGNYSSVIQDTKKICLINKSTESQQKRVLDLIDSYIYHKKFDQESQRFMNDIAIGEIQDQNVKILKLLLTTQNTIYNMTMMTFCWIASSATFFLMNFYIKYIPGDIYTISMIMGFSCIGYLISDFISLKYDVVRSLNMAYGIVSIIVFIILMVDAQRIHILVYSLLFFLLKTFVCMSYSSTVSHILLLDSRILATSYALCGSFSRLVNLLVPMIAEAENKSFPLKFLLFINLAAFIASFLIRRSTKLESSSSFK